MEHIIVEDGVLSLPDGAFYECRKLRKVELPSSLRLIGRSAFYRCKGLQEINIPDSVTNIASYAFFLSGICDLTLPDSIQTIGGYAFGFCEDLKMIRFPSNPLLDVGPWVCYQCKSLESVLLPDGVRSIPDYAFLRCRHLTTVYMVDSMVSIGQQAFDHCRSLNEIILLPSRETGNRKTVPRLPKGTIHMPTSLESIGQQAFLACHRLKKVVLPSSLKDLGPSAFGDCSGLTSVKIPPSLNYLGEGAFWGCSHLALVQIYPSRDLFIGSDAFGSCPSLFRTTCSDAKVLHSSHWHAFIKQLNRENANFLHVGLHSNGERKFLRALPTSLWPQILASSATGNLWNSRDKFGRSRCDSRTKNSVIFTLINNNAGEFDRLDGFRL